MEKFIHEIPNLFVFSGDYPHFAITTQDGITNIIEKQQDFILEMWIIQNIPQFH